MIRRLALLAIAAQLCGLALAQTVSPITNQCDGIPLDVTESEGYLEPKRRNNGLGYVAGNCTWNIQAPEGMTIEFTIGMVNTHGCRHGVFLMIVDGNGNEILGKTCGRKNVQPVMSETNTATVFFVAPKTHRRKSGFGISYMQSTPPEPGTDPCEIPGLLLEGTTGSGQSNGFRVDLTGSYESRQDCRWEIKGQPEHNVILTFDHFEVENHRRCRRDWVSVFDGPDDTAYRIGQYCGSTIPPPIKSSDESLFINFRSNGQRNYNGFSFNYEAVPFGTPNDGSYPGCGGSPQLLTQDAGELTSPNFGSEYPSDSYCAYEISVEDGKQIQITFLNFGMEEGGDNCSYDSVTIYDGPDNTHPVLGKFCGSYLPSVEASSNNQVYIEFNTDSSKQGDGFKLMWQKIENVDPCSGGGVVLSGANSGSIKSPKYGEGQYDNDKDCYYRIELPNPSSQILINWVDFDMEEDPNCQWDYLEVFDGEDASADSLGRFCNSQEPATIKSSSGDLKFHFHTDRSITARGFHLTYDTVTPGDPDDGSDPACGGKTQTLSGASGQFTSPNFGADYKSNADCRWQVNGEADKMLKFTFTTFELEESKGCIYDSLTVYPGADDSSNAIRKMCGSTANDISVRGSQAFFRFKTDGSGQAAGFQVQWTSEEMPEPAECGVPDANYPLLPRQDTPNTIPALQQSAVDRSGKRSNEEPLRIVGGDVANKYSIPWQVALLRGGSQICGGSILNERWVVTAAHCTDGTPGTSFSIRAGEHTLNVGETYEQEINVARKYDHPQYNSRTTNNDISLLELDQPLDLNDKVKPICLTSQEPNDGDYCLTSGWGTTSEQGPGSNVLRQVYMRIASQSSCRSSYGQSSITNQMICAGGDGNVDACYGDSGGPLVCQKEANGPWYLHGITSWGNGCARENYPGVWARVTAFKQYIESTTNNEVVFE